MITPRIKAASGLLVALLAALSPLAPTLAPTAAQARPISAADDRVGGVEIRAPWTRPAAAGMTGVGYMVIANTGKTPLRLIGAQSPTARMVSLHQTAQQNGVASMRALPDGVTIAPGAQLVLAPGGYHLMLMGLNKAQVVGDRTPLTLIFEGGRRVQVALKVSAAAPASEIQGESEPHHHH